MPPAYTETIAEAALQDTPEQPAPQDTAPEAPMQEAPAQEEPEEEEPPVEAAAQLLPQVVSPLDGTTVTVFSMSELLYDETMADWRTHEGLDIHAAAGEVTSVTQDELMGTTVCITHSGGYVTKYSSLQENPPISQGQQLAAGDIVGYVGTAAAEASMGPHLHFSVEKDGTLIDPKEYVK